MILTDICLLRFSKIPVYLFLAARKITNAYGISRSSRIFLGS